MLKFLLIEETIEKVVYKYYPEGGSDFGIVSYDKKTKSCSVVTLSETDKYLRYAHKMFAKIRKCASADSFQKEGIIAWG